MMKHSQYIELTSKLKGFSDNAGTLRVLFSKVDAPADPDTLEPGHETKRVPSDQAKQHTGYRSRYRMLDNEEKAIRETLDLMAGTVDGWTDENQDRADQGFGPTNDVRKLYSAMSDFLVATETPIDGAGILYNRIREKVRAWMDQAVEWFPDLIKNPVDNENEIGPEPTRRGKVVTAKVDRGRLAKCFKDEFKTPRPGKSQSQFDMFVYATTTARFSKTDWGRIAYAIKWNHRIVVDRIRWMDFSKWLVEFSEIMGLEPPKDTRQNKYKDPAGTRQFITNWLSK